MKLTPYRLYNILLENFGSQNWWPIDKNYHKNNKSDPRFEIIVGAVLTQNTAWSNVEKALNNLKIKNMLDVKKTSELNINILQELIKPSGFFKQKADRIKNIASYLYNIYQGNLDKFFDREISKIREELLSLSGIGSETADSIILYAGEKPIFVVDAYTKRLCQRLLFDVKTVSYDEIQRFFQEDITKHFSNNEITHVYKEFHALIVFFAKTICKKKPNCDVCIIKQYCKFQMMQIK